jgi:aryl-alcohol dehydrogenase-like predicted oxidoreductase
VSAIAEVVTQVAQEIGHTPSQVALAWLRHQSGVIIPIVGVRKLTQFQDNLACLDVSLSPEHLQRLNEVSQIELGFPHDFKAQRHDPRSPFWWYIQHY